MHRVSFLLQEFPVWDFLTSGQMTVLMVFALMYCGTNGSRLVRPMTPA